MKVNVAFLEQFAQVAQLSQRNHATGWDSFGRNISGSALAVPVINAVVLSIASANIANNDNKMLSNRRETALQGAL